MNPLVDDTVFLRPMEPEDLMLLREIENNPEAWSCGNVLIPYSLYALKQFIAHTQNDLYADRQLRLMICLHENETAFGIIDLFNFKPRHSRAEVGITILKKYRGRGLALRALKILCDYAAQVLHLHSLCAYINKENQLSVQLFTLAGFSRTGLLKDWYMAPDGFHDTLVYQKILHLK